MGLLIVEDDSDVCESICVTLKNTDGFDYEIFVATDMFQAMSLYSDNTTIKVVLTDIKIEGKRLNGLDLVKVFRKNNITIPIIIFTGYDTLDFRKEAYILNVIHFLKKPDDLDKISHIVKSLIHENI
ncbi:MAG: response regulator [Halobacteriovoraceae bacterium]|jgi:two-component system, response regulator YesN|nr:response regulator [Halobacteriovoraceae bacterium]